MATLLAPQTLVNTGLLASYTTADITGNYYVNTGKELLHVKNGSGVSITVTVDSVALDSFGNAGHDLVYTLVAGAELLIGYLSKRRFNDTEAEINVTFSAITTVTVAVIKVVYQL